MADAEPAFPNPIWDNKSLASEHMRLTYYDRAIIITGRSVGKTTSMAVVDQQVQRICHSMVLKIWTNPQQVWTASPAFSPSGTRFVSVLSDRGGDLHSLETQFFQDNLGIVKLSDRDSILYRIFEFFCRTGLLPTFTIPTTAQKTGLQVDDGFERSDENRGLRAGRGQDIQPGAVS